MANIKLPERLAVGVELAPIPCVRADPLNGGPALGNRPA